MSHDIMEAAERLYKNTEIMAPMVRASTTPLRTLALKYGADTVYTEEIIDRSILGCDRIANEDLGTIDYVKKTHGYSKKQLKKLLKHQKGSSINNGASSSFKEIQRPVILRIAHEIERGRLVYQIGTGDSTTALRAAQMVQQDVDAIDINMGCPKKFSTAGGMGSQLLKDVGRACDIVKTLRRNLTIPVSCKIRLLHDTSSTVDFVRALEQAGACAIAVHAREVGDVSTEPAKWDRLEPVISAINVPSIVNGDMYTRADMEKLKKMSGADSVMLARPALYNTSIFRKDGNTLPKHEVVRDYLFESLKWSANYVNVKYVVCEFMNNRRAPHTRLPDLPQVYRQRQSIQKVCECKSIEDLCHLWDVSTSAVKYRQSNDNCLLDRVYDDRYFTAPDELKKIRSKNQDLNSSNNDVTQEPLNKKFKGQSDFVK